ncbi:MAG: butyrate kinase [Bacteroidales bacterium]|nr:butyrate kinase [Bacteroidales bacterium]MDD4215516.1 butyrate kinase [Bacteroidales bacterium]
MIKNILTINPGSTSTKIAVYASSTQLFLKNIKHATEELEKFEKISDQYEYRKNIIVKELKLAKIDLQSIHIIVGRGGLVKPIPSGIYEVNETMKNDLMAGGSRQHASNLGGLIADDLAKMIPGAKAYISDPVVVDELDDVARISGHPEFKRISIFHALNQKAIGRMYAKDTGMKYKDLNLIVVHMGGGISVGAHKKGRVVDVNQALDGEGPFSPERSGTLPAGDLVRLCFSGKYSQPEILKMITGKGGFVAYLGTNNAYDVEQRVNAGDQQAKEIQEAMAYQIAKEIGSMAVALNCDIDAILLTGGVAYNKDIVDYITQKVKKIAPVAAYPGEDEMHALAMNGLMLSNGDITAMEYK